MEGPLQEREGSLCVDGRQLTLQNAGISASPRLWVCATPRVEDTGFSKDNPEHKVVLRNIRRPLPVLTACCEQ